MAKTGNRGVWTGYPTPTFTDKWQVSADNGASWSDVTTGSTFSDALMATHGGKMLRFVVAGSNVAGAATAVSPSVSLPSVGSSTTLPALTLTPTASSLQVGTASVAPGATLVANIAGAAQGATLSIPTDETRWVLNTAKTAVLVGVTALTTAGLITVSVVQTLAGATNSPRTTSIALSVAAAATTETTVAPEFPLDTLTGSKLILSTIKLTNTAAAPFYTATGTNLTGLAMQPSGGNAVPGVNGGNPQYISSISEMGGRAGVRFDGDDYLLSPANGFSATDSNLVICFNITRRTKTGRWEVPLSFLANGASAAYQANNITIGMSDVGLVLWADYASTAAIAVAVGETKTVAIICSGSTMQLAVGDTLSNTITVSARSRVGRFLIGGSVNQGDPYGSGQDRASCDITDLYCHTVPAAAALTRAWIGSKIGKTVAGGVDAAWTSYQSGGTPSTGGSTGGGTTGGGEVVTPPSTGTFSSISAADFEAFPYTTFAKTSPGSGVAGVLFPPTVPQPSGSNDIIGFNYTAGSRAGFAARQWDWAQALPAGMLMPSDRLEASINGGAYVPVQMDVLVKHPVDGSVFLPKLTTAFPTIAANGSVPVLLRKGAAVNAAANVTFDAMDNFPFAGSFTLVSSRPGEGTSSTGDVADGTTWEINFATLLASAKAAGPLNYWEQGPRMASIRLIQTFKYALRMVADITKFSDNTYRVDLTFAADMQGWSNPTNLRAWTINASLTQSGSTVHTSTNLFTVIGKVWRKVLYSGDAVATNAMQDPTEPVFQFDVHALKRWGILPNWQTESDGVSATGGAMNFIASQIANANFRKPLSNNGMTTGWGATGAQNYIGLQTVAAAAYWMTGRDDAFRSMLGYAEIGCPWNFYDPQYGEAFSARRKTGLVYLYNQTGTLPPNTTLNGQNAGGWAMDLGHHPEPYFSPWIATGRRFFADRLEAAAAFQINVAYTRSKFRDTVIISNDQVREAAWKIRSVGLAAYGLPDRYTLKPYFVTVINDNCDYITNKMPTWKAIAGEPFGYLRDAGGGTSLKMWQNEHVYASFAWLAKLGFKRVKPLFANFFNNMAVGRFRQGSTLFPGNTVIYELTQWGSQDSSAPNVTTWAQWQAAVVAAGKNQANGWTTQATDGNWSNYLPNRTLSLIQDLFPADSTIPQARATFLALNPPYISDISNRRGGEIYDNIVPQPKA